MFRSTKENTKADGRMKRSGQVRRHRAMRVFALILALAMVLTSADFGALGGAIGGSVGSFVSRLFQGSGPKRAQAAIVEPTRIGTDAAWEITDEGELIIGPRPGFPATGRVALNVNTPTDGNKSGSMAMWPWLHDDYRDKITKVTINAKTPDGKPRVETFGNQRYAYMFAEMKNLKEVDLSGLLTTRVADVRGMFMNCTSLEELDLSTWINNGSMQYMQDFVAGCTSLKKFTLNNPDFHTRVVEGTTNEDDYESYTLYEGIQNKYVTYTDTPGSATGVFHTISQSGCQTQRMFGTLDDPNTGTDTRCTSLEEIDMSNITISTWKGPGDGDGSQNTFIRSIGGERSDGLPNLKKLNINNIKLPGLKAGILGGELVYHKTNLEELHFGSKDGGKIDIDDSINDTTHNGSYRSGLEEIVDKLIEGCTALKVADLSGWNTTSMQTLGKNSNTGKYTVFDFKDLIENWSFEKLIAEDAKIWMHYDDPRNPDPSDTISPYDISDGLTQEDLDNLFIDWVFDFADGDPALDRDGIPIYDENWNEIYKLDLESNPEDAHTLHSVISPVDGFGNLSNGTYIHENANPNPPDQFSDADGNTRIPKTYYLVNNINTTPILYISKDNGVSFEEFNPYDYSQDNLNPGDYHIELTDAGVYRVYSKAFSMIEWDNRTDATTKEAKLNSDVKLKFVYPDAAVDVNGKRHDVVLDVNSVTFKDMDRIPSFRPATHKLGEYKLDPYGVNPWKWGSTYTDNDGMTHTFQRTDQYRLVGTRMTGSSAVYDPSATYTRHLISASANGIDFQNQIYAYYSVSESAQRLSKGSGTYIDYDIKIDDALPDTSVIYWVGDLDVAGTQNWFMHDSDANQDKMLSDAYGPGSEGIVLGSGNDLNTLTFANNSGLERYEYNASNYKDSQLDPNGNYIVGTASDPNTSWSRFYLRAAAQGSSYTWTSGISCKTTVLSNADRSHDPLPPVYVIPEALKTVNRATPAGEYKNAFDFVIEKATEIETVQYKYFYEVEDNGENRREETPEIDLINSVDDSYQEVRHNDGGVVPLSILKYDAPGSTTEAPFGRHVYNEHKARAYVYRITEVIPNNAEGGILEYNKDKVVHYLQVIVSDPKTDLEMHKGTRADMKVGTYTGDAPDFDSISYSDIQWGPTRTTWSCDATYTGKDTADGRQIFIDASGKRFYRDMGRFLEYPSGKELKVAKNEQEDVKAEYNGTNYTVYVDKNGVQYIKVDTGFLTPAGVPLATSDSNAVFPDADDQFVPEEKKIEKDGESLPVQVDVHGKTYIKQGDKYYAVDKDGVVGDELDVEDGVFNPVVTDHSFYESKTATINGKTYPVKVDALGTEYVEVGSQYYTPDETELTAAAGGTVSPSNSDKPVTRDKAEGEVFIVNGHTIKKDTNGVKYYEDNGKYYSVLGTLLAVGTDVTPGPDDKLATSDYDIRQDEEGNLFYKGEGAYTPDGSYTTKYYNITKTDSGYTTNGSEYSMPNNLLDTTEAMVAGSFENTAKVSEIEIKKETVDGKAGEFTFEITFDSDFEPTVYAFDELTALQDENDEPLQFVKTGENTYRFTLTEGQTVTIKNIPLQTTYTVTEQFENNGWEFVSVDGDENAKSVTKTLTEERYTDAAKTKANPKWNYSHTFTNRFTELVVKKVLQGGTADDVFSFTAKATITGLEPMSEFTYGYMDEANKQVFKTAVADAEGKATIDVHTFTLKGEVLDGAGKNVNEGQDDIVLVLPKGAVVTVTEKPNPAFSTTWQLGDGEIKEVSADGAADPVTMDADKKQLTFFNRNVFGTVGIDLTKYLEGRAFKDGDAFTFMLTAEDGTPMPVTYDIDEKTFSPAPTTADATIVAGKVSASASFGPIVYRIGDLDKVEVIYSSASDAQKHAVASWSAYEDDGTTPKADAKGTIYEKTFTYTIEENPADSASGDSAAVTNDTRRPQVKIYVLWDPNANGKKGAIYASAGAKDEAFVTNADAADVTLRFDSQKNKFIDNKGGEHEFKAMLKAEKVYFTNEYASTATWTPEALKVLIGRPLERDQFKFKLKGVASEASDGWVKTNPPMPEGTEEGAEAQNELQDVAAATADPKGTNDVNGPVSWNDVTFTNEWLKKEVVYKDANAEQKDKVIYWEKVDGSKIYVYGPIPDDALAVVTVDGVSTGDTGVKFAEATDAQRKAAQGTTADSKWQLGGKTYIDNPDLVPDDAKGVYYETSRELTYKMWEVNEEASHPRYTYYDNEYELTVTITEKQDGTIEVTGPDETPVFYNTYQAAGKLTITANKVLDGRALQEGEFTFTLKNAKGEEVGTATNAADGSITFPMIGLTEYDLMDDDDNYDALRTPDGFYQKTFIFTVTETGPAADADGITRDKSTKTVAVTLQEDGKGTIKVVAVNNVAQDGGAANAGTFTNAYNASGSGNVTATKTLKGGKLNAGDFHFQLLDSKGTVLAITANDADGKLSFTQAYNTDQLAADLAADICEHSNATDSAPEKWTYTYTIKELKTDNRGTDDVEYDATGTTNGYEVKIEITDDGKGKLTATQLTDPKAEFTNKIQTVQISGSKKWVGKDGNTDDVMLTLWRKAGESTTATKVEKDFDGQNISVVWTGNDYTIANLPKYDEATGAEYVYYVTEDKVVDGYLPASYENADGATDAAYDGGSIINKALPMGEIDIKAKKILLGSTTLEDWADTFKITVKSLGANYTIPGSKVVPSAGTLTQVGDEIASVSMELTLGTLRFKLFVEEDGAGGTVKKAYVVNANGEKIAANGIVFSGDSIETYVQIDEEAIASPAGMDQSGASNKRIKLTITDKGDGTLAITAEPSILELTNKYETNAQVSIPIKKTLNGRELKANEFSFTATYKPDSSITGLAGERLAAGFTAPEALTTLTIDDTDKHVGTGNLQITFTKTGTYTFTIAETKGNLGGVTYDATTYDVTVIVSKDENGALVCAVTKPGASATEDPIPVNAGSPLTFTNTYQATGSATISVTKNIEGADWDDNMNFWFKIESGEGSPAQAPIPSGDARRRAAVKERQTVSWTIDGFTQEDIGKTYIYKITEQDPNGIDGDWELDKSTHTATVTWTDKGDGTLTPTVKYDVTAENPEGKSALTVTNTKKGNGANIHAIKKVTNDVGTGQGDYWRNGDSYTLVLEAAGKRVGPSIVDTNVATQPMPAGSTGTTKEVVLNSSANSDANFGTIMFDDTVLEIAALNNGDSITFVYNIYERIPANKVAGITYDYDNPDTNKHRAEVTVTRKDDGSLMHSVYYYDGTGGHGDPAVVRNIFDAAGEVELKATKVLSGGNLADFVSDFTFTLYEADGTTIVKDKDGAEIKDITPAATGTINLGTIVYGEDDLDLSKADGFATKTYILRETAGNKSGITYDTADKTIAVEIKLDGREIRTGVAQIVATQTETPTITNSYNPTGEAVLTVKKHLKERPISREGFNFKIEGLGTVPSIDHSNPEAGLVSGTIPMPSGNSVHIGAAQNYSVNGQASFGGICYTMEDLLKTSGTGYETSRIFLYKVYEEENNNAAITYDDDSKTVYYAFVTVTNDLANGKLEVAPAFVKKDVVNNTYSAASEMKFTNIYDSVGTVTINPIKQIIGREWTDADKFDFTIKAYQGALSTIGGGTHEYGVLPFRIPLPGNQPSASDPVGNKGGSATGSATINGRDVGNGEHFANFEPITFTDEMLSWDSRDGYLKGTFFYVITENTPVPDGFTQTGTTTFYAQVDVVDDRVGGITHHVYYYDDASKVGDPSKQMHATPVFQNSYKLDAEAQLPITKEIDGRAWKADDSFTFTLNNLNEAPMPAGTGSTLVINADTENHKGSFGIPVTLANLTSTTDTAGQLMYSDSTDAAPKPVPKGVKYAEFRYQVAEANAGQTVDGLVYGRGIYARMLVIDRLDGTIDVQISYYNDASFAETAKLPDGTITNIYDAFGSPATIEITKAVKDGDGNDAWGKLESGAAFTFNIEALNGAPAPKVYTENMDELPNAAEQTEITVNKDSRSGKVSVLIRMSDLEKDATTGLPKTTTFLYKVAEQPGDVTAVKYDTDPVYVKVTGTPDNTAKTLSLSYAYFTDAACTDPRAEGLTITNTYGVTDLKVEKIWNDGNADAATRPAITLHLTRSIDGGTAQVLTALPAGASVSGNGPTELGKYEQGAITVSADQLPITFTNLPALTADGKRISYSVTEDDPAGYQLTKTDTASEPGTVILTNTLLTEVKVSKVWYDGNDASRPTAVLVGLLENQKTLPVKLQFAEAAEGWKASFENLPAYDDEGQAITYTVKEYGVPAGYSSRVEGDAAAGFTIINTKLKDITVSKTWIGGASADAELKLYRSTNPSDASAFRTLTDGRKVWTVDNSWTEVDAHSFAESLFSYSTDGDTKTFIFKNLPAYDAEGKLYTYRVHEVASAFFTADQTDDLAVTNTNGYSASGTAKPNVVKELDGRPWLDTDRFYFKIEAVEIKDAAGQTVTLDGLTAPLPDDSIATVTKDNTQVGAIGRSVDFAPISFTNAHMLNADGSTAALRNFYYKIYEVNASGDKVTDGSGITYDTSIHTLRIEVTDNGDGTLSAKRFWDGSTDSSAVPVFTNTYRSEGVARIWIEKKIETRSWVDYDNGKGDAFQFEVTAISGSELNVPGSDHTAAKDSYTTMPLISNADGNPQSDIQKMSDTEYAFGLKGNTYTGSMLNSQGEGYFIYAISEKSAATSTTDSLGLKDYTVDDLIYDGSIVYVKIKVTDNWDGTLSFEAKYYEDAACTREITGRQVWIEDKWTGGVEMKRLLTTAEAAQAAAMSADEREAAGYRQVNVAYFTNILKEDVTVKKVWDGGPAVEDVTVHLQRALFTLAEESNLTDTYVNTHAKWEAVGLLHTFRRGEFAAAQEASYTFEDLPMYVIENGVTKRAVYKLTEDDTSDAYEPSYGKHIYINQSSGTLVVTNTVKAANTANIAAVKQLLGRQWMAGDSFEFTLKPIGKAAYGADGRITSVISTTNIPMPAAATATATMNTQVVDVEGKLERLARFDAISYGVSDLEYNPADRHHHGDFFYEISEEAGNQTGMTYSKEVHTVHVHVQENRTGQLVVQIAYDETTQGNIATGTQFTPVFTNSYDVSATVKLSLDKFIMGRQWVAGETFDFAMMPLAGAPFEDADPAEFGKLEEGKAEHNAAGAHVVRMKVTDADPAKQSVSFPAIKFTLSELNKKAAAGQMQYADGTAVPAGMAYGRFLYAFEEVAMSAADLVMDADTEYARITVIDKGNGTLDTRVEIFEDRYCTVARKDPLDAAKEAERVAFVNQLKRNLTVVKNWTDPATDDVQVKLQWSVDGTAWKDAEGTEWLGHVITTQTIAKGGSGVVFENLPAYVNDTGDDQGLNDKWVRYRVVEITTGDFDTRYSLKAYEDGKTLADYAADPLSTEAAGEARIDTLYVINFPKDFTGKAQVFVVKQLKGKEWDKESFAFKIEAVSGTLGDGSSVAVKDIPMPAADTAIADNSTRSLGYNQHNAEFAPISFSLSQLKVDPADGIAKGEFVYKVTEVAGNDANMTYTQDAHTVTITVTNNGNGRINTSLSWDGRPVGDFVPVYVNEYKSVTDSLTVEKVWADAENAAGLRPKSVTFHLYKVVTVSSGPSTGSGTVVEISAGVDAKTISGNGTATWTDLPVYDENGQSITYKVVEEAVAGYTAAYSAAQTITLDGDTSKDPQTITVTNTLAKETTKVSVTKVWADSDGKKRVPVEVALYEMVWNGSQYEKTADPVKKTTLAVTDDASVTWEGLPAIKNGRTVIYTVEEITQIPGYRAPVVSGNQVDGFTITNTMVEKFTVTYDPNNGEEKTTTTVEKGQNEPAQPTEDPKKEGHTFGGWDRSQDKNGNVIYKARWIKNPEPGKIKVKYLIPDPTDPEKIETKLDETIQRGQDEPAQPKDPKKDGFLFIGWKRSVDSESGHVTYTAQWKQLLVSIPVMKKWEDKDNQDGKRAEVEVTLMKQIGEAEPAADGMLKLNEANNWAGVFENKPLVDEESGQEITYSVVETGSPKGYETKVEAKVKDDPSKGFVVTNTYNPAITGITAVKKWDKEPESIGSSLRTDVILHLFGTVEGQVVYEAEARTIAKGAEGEAATVTWTGLPTHHEGKELSWKLSEEAVPGYAVHVSGKGTTEDPFVVTNSYIGPVTEITVSKTWDDQENVDGVRPASITYELWKKVGDGEAEKADEKTVTAADAWSYTWSELPAVEESGAEGEALKPILYSVKEQPVTGYNSLVEAVGPGQFKAVNIHQPETVAITVKKAWSDGENQDGIRPDHVTVKLLADGKEVANAILSGEEGWTYTFVKLPKNKLAEGKSVPVVYSVEEEKVEGYEYSVSGEGTAENPFVITNTHDAAASLTLKVSKVWAGDEADPSGRQAVKLHLMKIVEGYGPVEVKDQMKTIPADAAGEALTVTWSGLSAMEGGKPVTYSVEEEAVSGYTSAISDGKLEGNSISITVTNTLIPEEEPETITVTYQDPDPEDPTDVTKIREDIIIKGDSEDPAPADPKRDGYKFTGWVRETDPETGNVTYTASWEKLPEPEQISVKYVDPENEDPEKRELVDETIVKGQDEPAQPADPTRDGYEFLGWSRETDPKTGDVTYTAQWKKIPDPEKKIIRYVDPSRPEGEQDILKETIDKEANEPAQPADPERDGYKFTGWKRNVDPESGDVTYEAQWEEVPAPAFKTITYRDPSKPEGEQEILKESIGKDADEPAQPADPVRAGYVFGGWDRSVDQETGDVVYTARWTPEATPEFIQVSYEDGSGRVLQNDRIVRGQNEPGQPADPVKPGYTFGGWSRSVDPASNDVTYTARWTAIPGITPKVTYLDPKAPGGRMILSYKEYDGQAAADKAMEERADAPADPSHEGLIFTGWDVNQDASGDYILVAKYNEKAIEPVPETRIVTYVDPQAESGKLVILSAAVGLNEEGSADESGLTMPGSPSHADMQFVGWEKSLDAGGNVVYTAKYGCDCANVPPAPTEPPTTVPEPVEGTTEPWATVPPVPETTAPVISPTQALPTEPYRPTVPPVTQPTAPEMGDPGNLAAWTIIGLTALNSLGITFLLNRKKREED